MIEEKARQGLILLSVLFLLHFLCCSPIISMNEGDTTGIFLVSE